MTRATVTFDSPLGPVTVTATGDAIAAVFFGPAPDAQTATPLLDDAAAQLRDYFAGTRTAFDLPLAPPRTPFQGRIRAAMQAIPYGETRTYGALADRIGSAARAVGQACGGNPIPIIVPCHRVLAAAGGIGGYSAGRGIATKRWLLAHETRTHAPDDLFAHAR